MLFVPCWVLPKVAFSREWYVSSSKKSDNFFFDNVNRSSIYHRFIDVQTLPFELVYFIPLLHCLALSAVSWQEDSLKSDPGEVLKDGDGSLSLRAYWYEFPF